MNIQDLNRLDHEQQEVCGEILRWRDQVLNDLMLYDFYTNLLNAVSISAKQTLSEPNDSASALGQSTHKPQEE